MEKDVLINQRLTEQEIIIKIMKKMKMECNIKMDKKEFYKAVEKEVVRERTNVTLYPTNEKDRETAEKVFRDLGYDTNRITNSTNPRNFGLTIWRRE